MIESDIIIVGGGPAGSTCAWKLKQYNISSTILDKKEFPRPKLCAGWITPKVLRDLHLNKKEYPHSLKTFDRLNCYFGGKRIPIPTRQYSIRRYELDNWLIDRSGAQVIEHTVKNIRKENNVYILDDKYRCRYLVGAGGTGCRVYHSFFKEINPRSRDQLITTLEEEFEYDTIDPECHLWFLDNKLPGYSWYVPKGHGILNVGIGGKLARLKKKGKTIRYHWNLLVEKLNNNGLVKNHMFSPKGYNYFLRRNVQTVERDNAFIIGDAAGLATVDMGEGIGPAIKSGILAADAIVNGTEYSVKSISKYSIFEILLARWKTL